ncbi:MAG TPA: tricarballylate utilization 4Fe-4S protein TcuB [Acidimicrobiales bacterium]|nr:tricarballylate utilization 4Fe-4S protein TcuB [Acidimicrobiales bacterium]
MSATDPAFRYRNDEPATALFTEAKRQLNVCNSCRFCEGYCAVYPALERRVELEQGDIIHLANLCHDCRACFYACMYAPPHEFGLNPPAILAEVRRDTYQSSLPLRLRQRDSARGSTPLRLSFSSALCCIAIVLTLISVNHGLAALFRRLDPVGSPYAFVSYEALIVVSLLIFGCALVVMTTGMIAYWKTTRGRMADLFHFGPLARAIRDGATLRYLRGGREGCYVKENHASSERRILHYLVSYGFLLCLLATISAGFEQDVLSAKPPFALLSVPVVSGVLGGIGLIIGSLGLYRLKRSQDTIATDGPMNLMDRSFLFALATLGVTGIATLVTRDSTIYGFVLAIHLAVVWSCFILAPFTKFAHFLYRLLALVQDNLERTEGTGAQ